MRQHDSHENVKEFIVTSSHVMPRRIISQIANVNREREREHVTQTLNTNVTTARRSRVNETSQNIMTRHVRHIFTQGDQTKQKIFLSCNQFVNCNISIPSKQNGLLQYNNQEFDCYNNQSHLA